MADRGTSARTTSELVRTLFMAVDALEVERVAPFIAEDVTLQFGSAPPILGKADFVTASSEFNSSIAGLRHEISEIWEPEAGVVVAVLEVHYLRHDGSHLTLPCCNIFRFRDGLVYDYRIFMDVNPVYA